jgi:hypothetical protein
MTSTSADHATEWVRHVNGKEYVVTTDESYALTTSDTNGLPNQCKQQSFGRMIDISDEKHPVIVGTFEQDANKKSVCPDLVAQGGNIPMVHYLNFDDRNNMRVAVYASASGGIRFVDWTDPTSPKEIAYYVKERNTPSKMDFTRPDPRYDPDNCMYYTGWNQGGLVSIELTNPQYNSCMRRQTNGTALLGNGKARIQVSLEAQRNGNGLNGFVTLTDTAANANVQLTSITRLGSAIDACGSVQAQSNSIQIDGTGTFNGAPATFRACVQDMQGLGKGTEADRFYLTCTSGCSYSAGGPTTVGKLIVRERSAWRR